MSHTSAPQLREVEAGDLNALCRLENACFTSDRLSRRRMRHFIAAGHRVFIVVCTEDELLGYGLVLLHRGTRLARLYSLAVAPQARGQGIGGQLVAALERAAADRGRLYMRLEVAEANHGAIALYRSLGYATFGRYDDYYEDHQPALRMQKRVRYVPAQLKHLDVPWYRQTTEFSCGPAALMMAMAALRPEVGLSRELELDVWREATTIYMTSGHGGCHPVGLALAAQRRGYRAEVWLKHAAPLFIDGVRNPEKKEVIALVHRQFMEQAGRVGLRVHQAEVTQAQLGDWIESGCLVLALISTYRLDGRKAPHWVTITAMDESCLYVHDPDPTEGEQSALDCQYLPIARKDFDRMAQFGRERLTAYVRLSP